MSFYPAQLQAFTLSGSGASSGATTVKLTSMKDIGGTVVAMSSFGTKGYATIEPNAGIQEEQISFTGITQNSDGTATLTGVSTVAFLQPFTETSGTSKSHAGGTTLVISNTSGFYNRLTPKDDAVTITSVWTFSVAPVITPAPVNTTDATNKIYVDTLVLNGAPAASTTVQGNVQIASHSQIVNRSSTGSTNAKLVITPDQQPSVLIYDYVADTGTPNTYAIAPSPAVTSYVAGLTVYFKAKTTNTSASTLNVNGLGAKNLVKSKNIALAGSEITTNYVVAATYDGAQFQMRNVALPKISIDSRELYATSTTGNTAYVVALSPAVTAYVAGLTVSFKPDTTGGHPTLNLNGLGAKNIKRYSGNSFISVLTGDIPVSSVARVIYDGTQFQLLNPSSLATYKNGTTTHDVSTTTTNTIAHGLGTTPKYVRLTASIAGASGAFHRSMTVYNGTTQSSQSAYGATNGTTTVDTNFRLGSGTTDAATNYVEGTVTFDATNITVTWTQNGSTTGTYQILWEAFS